VIEDVRVVGRVWVPSAWKCGSALITMHLLDTPQVGFEAYSRAQGSKQASEREGFDRFDWALGHVQPGRYELGVFQPPFSTAIVVEPRAGQEFDLVVPPPIEVSVRVVDADTGFDAVVHAVMWNPVRPEGVAGGGVQLAQRNEGTQRYELLASSSALEVFTLDERFNMVDDANASAKSYTVNGGSGLCTVRPATFDVSGPRAELVLRVRPVCGFVLRLREDETPVAVPEDWHVNVQPVSGRGRLVRERPEPPGWRCVVSEAGAYTVELLPLDGYLPIPQQTVTVMAGEFVEHVVELVREP
jgi:hypothetical protein